MNLTLLGLHEEGKVLCIIWGEQHAGKTGHKQSTQSTPLLTYIHDILLQVMLCNYWKQCCAVKKDIGIGLVVYT